MKKKILGAVFALLLINLTACNSQAIQDDTKEAKVETQTENVSKESADEQIRIEKDEKEERTTDSKKSIVFQSADEVENISDEDLIYILEHGYDAFGKESYSKLELTDIETQESSEGWQNVEKETVRIEVLDSDLLGEIRELDEPISSEDIMEYAQIDIKAFFDAQNSKEPDEETGILVVDDEIIFCKETDFYVEYSARYLESRSYYYNDELVTNYIPRAYRMIYMKTLFQQNEEEYWDFLLLGKLTPEYVKAQMDLYMADRHGVTLYCEIEEEEDGYVYTRYYAYMVYGDFGLDDEACLCKESNRIDKKTHLISCSNSQEIKSVMIRKNRNVELELEWSDGFYKNY